MPNNAEQAIQSKESDVYELLHQYIISHFRQVKDLKKNVPTFTWRGLYNDKQFRQNLIDFIIEKCSKQWRDVLLWKDKERKRRVLNLVMEYNIIPLKALILKKMRTIYDVEALFTDNQRDGTHGSVAMALAMKFHPDIIQKALSILDKKELSDPTIMFLYFKILRRALLNQNPISTQIMNKFMDSMDNSTDQMRYNFFIGNLLNLAAEYEPIHVSRLVQLLSPLSNENRLRVLEAADKDGFNALTKALRSRNREAIEAICDGISDLEDKKREDIDRKMKILYEKKNALSEALKYHPESVDRILKMISDMDEYYEQELFFRCDGALESAVRYCPERINDILDRMEQIYLDKKKYNRVFPLTDTIPSFDHNQYETIINLAIEKKLNIWPRLIKYFANGDWRKMKIPCNILHPFLNLKEDEYDEHAKKVLEKLVEDRRFVRRPGSNSEDKLYLTFPNVLYLTNTEEMNSLMLAFGRGDERVKDMLLAIEKMIRQYPPHKHPNDKEIHQVFKQQNQEDMNALMLALNTRFQPESINKMIEIIALLDKDTIKCILFQKNKAGESVLTLIPQHDDKTIQLNLVRLIETLDSDSQKKAKKQLYQSKEDGPSSSDSDSQKKAKKQLCQSKEDGPSSSARFGFFSKNGSFLNMLDEHKPCDIERDAFCETP